MLRSVLGVIALIVALAIVGLVAWSSLRSQGLSGAASVPERNASVASEAKRPQDKARDDVSRALQDGARRNEAAEH